MTRDKLWNFNRDSKDLTENTNGSNQDLNEWDSLRSPSLQTSGVNGS